MSGIVSDAILQALSFRNLVGKDHIWRSVSAGHPDNYEVIAAGEQGGRVAR